MTEHYNDILCIYSNFLIKERIISYDQYKNWNKRDKINVVRRGCRNTPALIEFKSLPSDIQNIYIEKHGDPEEGSKKHTLMGLYSIDAKAVDFYANYFLGDGRNLSGKVQKEYIANASMLSAITTLVNSRTLLIKSLGGSVRRVWPEVSKVVSSLKSELGHTLPDNHRRLKTKCDLFREKGYESLIHGSFLNKNSKKVIDIEQEAVLRELLRKHTQLDNVQISEFYNTVASAYDWKKITDVTVGNYRKKWKMDTYAGQRGVSEFDNNVQMIVKRKAPVYPMTYWTLDGWDVELLYQKTENDQKGHSRTTYHNRLTVVVVLDACKKYPIGYAIGTHETPALIRSAIRNAINHTRELFGDRHKVLQLQTDNYGKGTLTPFYEACSDTYTPARAHNAKSKVIEPYFAQINKKYCKLCNNWSGFGIASGSKNQPNQEYLNKIRHSFPDEDGVRTQIEHMIAMEREMKRDDYVELFKELPSADKHLLSDRDYLYHLGETTGHTNRMTNIGVVATIEGVKREYDSFDVQFRNHSHTDWILRYDPEAPENVLATNDDGSVRFMLAEKYVQPMALYDRQEGDVEELVRIQQFNKTMKDDIVERIAEDRQLVDQIFEDPKLNNTLAKLVICDSNGQHKDVKSYNRLNPAKKLLEKQNKKEKQAQEKSWAEKQEEYLDSKVDLSQYINN